MSNAGVQKWEPAPVSEDWVKITLPPCLMRAVATMARGVGCQVTKKVHRGFPGKAALIFRKKYSESLNP
ncbi:hypothetical protein, partial [Aeromonas caviae]|uniref:hypothetical protein n=1 Tax=Aeromonas caviae TaxID=648 RepID=UPI002B48F79E